MNSETGKLNSKSTLRLNKQDFSVKITERKLTDAKYTQKQVSKELGLSDSTLKRFGDEINIKSSYNKQNTLKKLIRTF